MLHKQIIVVGVQVNKQSIGITSQRVKHKRGKISAEGPLYMSLTSKSYVKFLMFSYETAGCLGSRDLGFSNRHHGKLAGRFCHIGNTSSRLPAG